MPIIEEFTAGTQKVREHDGVEVERPIRAKAVKGLPRSWGMKAYEQLRAALDEAGPNSERYKELAVLLDKVTAAPIPLDATDAHLCVLAERYASDCATHGAVITEPTALRARLAHVCATAGIEPPDYDNDAQAIMRCNDPLWWRARLRKLHGRTFEAAAIRLGMVSSQKAKYCSDETVARRIAQNSRNARGLETVNMLNMDTDQVMTLAELAAKGMGNKKLRRGEMMMRMAGCDKIAKALGHRGLFVTVTAPGAYHAVLQKSGKPNPKFNGATPIETHEYFNNLWKLTRAKNDRDGIAPYGFRVAEPHHDGCTHWHMLVFMPAKHMKIFIRNLTRYALAEDGDEAGAKKTRVTFKALDPAKGQAAGYMAKYVAKNIGENDIEYDLFGKPVITSAMRVDAWAGTWGIRQFQPLGQPPVTVYRELRRVDADTVAANDVPDHIKRAHAAGQRIVSKTEKDANGEPLVIQRAEWAEYVEAQGGVKVGKVKTKTRDYSAAVVVPYKSKRRAGQYRFVGIKTRTKVQPLMSQGRVGGYAIGLYAPVVMAEGRYGLAPAKKPMGVFCRAEADVVYKSKRYTWKKTGRAIEQGLARRAGVVSPWSPVNNCTASDWPARPKAGDEWFRTVPEPGPVAEFSDEDWYASEEFARYWIPPEDVAAMELAAEARQPFDAGLLSERARAAFDAQAAYARANR